MEVKNEAFCRDCMEALKEFPDKYFDLAVVDPPYGDALTNPDGGVTKTDHLHRTCRKMHHGGTSSADSEKATVCRTGGTWAAKFGKK